MMAFSCNQGHTESLHHGYSDRRQGRRTHPVRQMVRHRVKVDGVEYLIMKESDIMGVLVETEVRKKAA
jgi:hypothetical protein